MDTCADRLMSKDKPHVIIVLINTQLNKMVKMYPTISVFTFKHVGTDARAVEEVEIRKLQLTVRKSGS